MNSLPTIAEILPHKAPLLLLDELLECGDEHVACGVTITASALFCEAGKGVPAWVGLEYMAQTVAAYSGVDEVRQGISPTIGLLLGSRRYRSEVDYFSMGTRLRIVAQLLLRDEHDLVAFDCSIYSGDTVLARGDLKAYRPKDVHAVIRGDRIG